MKNTELQEHVRQLSLRLAHLQEFHEAKFDSLVSELVKLPASPELRDVAGSLAMVGYLCPNLRLRLQHPDAVAWFQQFV